MTDILPISEDSEQKTSSGDKLTAERIAEIQEVFSFFDKDADGSVSIDDLGPMIRSIGFNPSDSEIKMLTGVFKNDGKQSLEFADFLVLVPTIERSGDSEAELMEAFQVFDKDGTGRIGSVELRHVITNLGEKLSEEDADELLRFADEASQGDVNYKEFVQQLLAG